MSRRSTFICILVAVAAFGLARLTDSEPHSADAQTGGSVVMTSCASQNMAHLFVYNTGTQQVASYTMKTTGSLELKGIRTVSSDFHGKVKEFPRSNLPTAVRNMERLIEQVEKEQQKDQP